MYRIFALMNFFLLPFLLVANTLREFTSYPVKEVDFIDANTLNSNKMFISMPFASELIINPEKKKQIDEKVILKIELVYTKFKLSPTFNQAELNLKRLVELQKLLPKVFENPLWEFELIGQTKGTSQDECKTLFHGFIISFRPNSTTKTLANELEYLNKLVNNSDSLQEAKSYELKTRWDTKIGYVHDTIWKIDNIIQVDPPAFFYDPMLFKDTTVLSVLERNVWKNIAVVTDVTGSMSPFTAQVLEWLKQKSESKTANYFAFFNDGNRKESNEKKPLKTGGIYGTPNLGIDEVMKSLAKCMQNGSGGGEGLENDVEAILFALEEAPSVDEIVLIADNFESMRDYSFIDKITKPVRIIVCGVKKKVNIQYLDMARKTKGSVHTKTSDISNLDLIKPKQKITIDGEVYIFDNERFHFYNK
ncbi:MAG: hypothetical protein IT232_08275 [Flavobacteriales bacterium]|nr:hypothetical protein [Flavobacteriales bacterium]